MRRLKIFVWAIIFMMGVLVISAGAFMVSVNEADFKNAADAYKQGDYKKSSELYSSILSRGVESGDVYYNLANAYFKQGQLGRAILNYERAWQLIPNDRDVEFNYDYARAGIKGPRVGFKSSWLYHQLNQCSFDGIWRGASWIIFIIGTLFILSFYARWPGMVRGISAVVIGAIFLGAISMTIMKNNAENNMAIALNEVVAKFEPRDEATTHFSLYEGTKVKIVGSLGNWIKVERLDGKEGWIMKESVEKIK